jgi:hypothetical protein
MKFEDDIFGSADLNEFKNRINFPMPKFPWYKSLWFKIRYFIREWRNILFPLRPLNIQKCPRCRNVFELNFSKIGVKCNETLDIDFNDKCEINEVYIDCRYCDYYTSLKRVN